MRASLQQTGPRVLLVGYAALTVTELVGVAASRTLSFVADLLLMPVLAVLLIVGAGLRTPLVRWTVVGLALSWAGDSTGNLLVKLGFFLPAVLAYAAGFRRYRRGAPLARPRALAGFGVVLAGLIVLSAVHAGPLAVPVAVYGLAVGAMVVTASGVNRPTAAGAVAFLLSDVALALDAFVLPGRLPAGAELNQVLYLPGQALIAVGVLRRTRRSVAP